MFSKLFKSGSKCFSWHKHFLKFPIKNLLLWDFLVVPWSRFYASNTGGAGSISGHLSSWDLLPPAPTCYRSSLVFSLWHLLPLESLSSLPHFWLLSMHVDTSPDPVCSHLPRFRVYTHHLFIHLCCIKSTLSLGLATPNACLGVSVTLCGGNWSIVLHTVSVTWAQPGSPLLVTLPRAPRTPPPPGFPPTSVDPP